MDPVTGALILGGANFLGGLLGGASSSKLSKEQLLLQQELGRRGLGIQETQLAPNIANMLQMSPIKDKVLHTLMARIGQAPGTFKPTDILGGTNFTPQMGGINQEMLQGQMNQYTPGAGGVDPELYKAMLARLGYMSSSDPKRVLTHQAQNQSPTQNAPVAGAPKGPSNFSNMYDTIRKRIG